MRLSHGQAQEIAERASAIVATDYWGRRVHGATWVDFTVSNELRFALAAADVLGLAEASELIHYARRHKRARPPSSPSPASSWACRAGNKPAPPGGPSTLTSRATSGSTCH